jgi:hypothetical protein
LKASLRDSPKEFPGKPHVYVFFSLLITSDFPPVFKESSQGRPGGLQDLKIARRIPPNSFTSHWSSWLFPGLPGTPSSHLKISFALLGDLTKVFSGFPRVLEGFSMTKRQQTKTTVQRGRP